MENLIQNLIGIYFNLLSIFSKPKAAAKAFALFCTVRRGKVLEQQKEFLNAAKLNKLDIANHQVQSYHWPGTKATVLLVHGWESNTYRWRNLIAILQEADFNVISIDAPAHGNSSGKELNVPLHAETLQHMISLYNPLAIIAHSLGGMTALYNEYQHKNAAVDKIVTIAAPSKFSELMNHYQGLLKLNNNVMKALDDYVLNRFGFRIHEFSTQKFVRELSTKGLIFHDRFDKRTPYQGSKVLHENWNNSQLITTEGFGHSMHQNTVNERIIDFLES